MILPKGDLFDRLRIMVNFSAGITQRKAEDGLHPRQHPTEHPDGRAGGVHALTGDRRLSDALAECDARDWDALPLAPKHLTRFFPALWDTEKAAERWIAKTPRGL